MVLYLPTGCALIIFFHLNERDKNCSTQLLQGTVPFTRCEELLYSSSEKKPNWVCPCLRRKKEIMKDGNFPIHLPCPTFEEERPNWLSLPLLWKQGIIRDRNFSTHLTCPALEEERPNWLSLPLLWKQGIGTLDPGSPPGNKAETDKKNQLHRKMVS